MKWNDPTQLHPAPRPRKKPKQGRSKHLVSAIRIACLKIIDEQGTDALTTNRIAEVAGVGIASVYQYFPNKEAVLSAIYDELLEQERVALEQMSDKVSRLDARASLEYHVDRGIDLRRRLLRIAPDFYQKYHREFELTTKYSGEPEQSIEDVLRDTGRFFLDHLSKDLRAPNNRLTQYIFTRGIGAIIDKAAEDNPELLDNAQFRTLLKDLVVRFLLCDQAITPDAMPE